MSLTDQFFTKLVYIADCLKYIPESLGWPSDQFVNRPLETVFASRKLEASDYEREVQTGKSSAKSNNPPIVTMPKEIDARVHRYPESLLHQKQKREEAVRTEFAIVVGKVIVGLEKLLVQVEDAVRVLNKIGIIIQETMMDVATLLSQLHKRRKISMFYTDTLEVLIEELGDRECQGIIKNYLEAHLKPYLISCKTTVTRNRDQNHMEREELGTDPKTVVLTLGSEWSRLSIADAQQAKRKIASLLELGEVPLQIQFNPTLPMPKIKATIKNNVETDSGVDAAENEAQKEKIQARSTNKPPGAIPLAKLKETWAKHDNNLSSR